MEINKLGKILGKSMVIILITFLVAVVLRMIYVSKNTPEQVAKIHATKLTLDDVMGKNLPPDPGAEADKTVSGIDANQNGIRDDVELAIFKEYPNSAKTRAVLLQYALALQMEMMQPFINEETVGAVSNIEDGAFFCITKIVSGDDKQNNRVVIEKYENFVLATQLDTDARRKARDYFYDRLGSGSVGESKCDIDLSLFPN